MLGMPKLVQQWKQVSVLIEIQCCGTVLMVSADGSWPWLEEVAEVISTVGAIASFIKDQTIFMETYKLSMRISSEQTFHWLYS